MPAPRLPWRLFVSQSKPKATPAPAPAAATGGSTASAATAATTGAAPPASTDAAGSGGDTGASGTSGGDGVLSGAALEAKVQELMAMGFPEEQVRAAMRAAFNHGQRALQYLLDGIPADVAAASASSAPSPAPSAAPTSGGSSPLDMLRSVPGIDQLRRQVQSDPSVLPQVLAMLTRQSPALGQWLATHREEFINFINEPVGEGGDGADGAGGGGGGVPGLPPGFNPQLLGALIANLPDEQLATMAASMQIAPAQLKAVGQALAVGGGGGGAPPGSRVVRLTQEEAAAVQSLEALGFSRQRALEAYLICDKNQEAAANYLFSNPE